MDSLVEFWNRRKAPLRTRPYIHPKDKETLKKYECCEITRLQDYNKDEAFMVKDRRFHLGLLPVPYMGNLSKSSIFMLMLNPTVKPVDYYAEAADEEYRKHLLKNIRQELGRDDFPFVYLNPKFIWRGGGQYWWSRLKDWVSAVKKEKGLSNIEALSAVSDNLAVVQLVAYHAQKGPTERCIDSLQTSVVAKRYVGRIAKEGTKLIICARGADHWALPEESDKILIYSGSERRYASLSRDSRGGRRAIDFLRKCLR